MLTQLRGSEGSKEHDRENLYSQKIRNYKQTVNRNVDTKSTAGEVSEGIEKCFLEFEEWGILIQQKLSCLCSAVMWKAKLTYNKLGYLADGIFLFLFYSSNKMQKEINLGKNC